MARRASAAGRARRRIRPTNPTGAIRQASTVSSHPPHPNAFRSRLRSFAAPAAHRMRNRCQAGASRLRETGCESGAYTTLASKPAGCARRRASRKKTQDEHLSGRIPSLEPGAMFAAGGECRVHVVRQRAPRRGETVAMATGACKQPLAFLRRWPNPPCGHIAVAAVRTKRYPRPPAIGGSDSTRTLRNPKRWQRNQSRSPRPNQTDAEPHRLRSPPPAPR